MDAAVLVGVLRRPQIERGKGAEEGRSERGPGGIVANLGASGRSQAGWRSHAVAVRASGTRYASDWQEEEDLPAPGGLGRPDGLPGKCG